MSSVAAVPADDQRGLRGVPAGGPESNVTRPTGAAHPAPTRRVRVFGMPLSVVTEPEVVDHIVSANQAKRGGWVITPNLDHLRLFRKDPSLRGMFEAAELVTADGMPLVWASRLQRTPLPQRVSGSALIHSLTDAAAREGLSVFFLGGNPSAAERTAEQLRHNNPALKVAGTSCPPPGFDQDPQQVEAIRQQLLAARPDIVFVGLGFPKQERLIEQLRASLPAAWFLGIGISFSFVSGEVKRAPVWMQHAGLEWLHRLIQEPGRLGKRYLVHGIPFAGRLLLASLTSRFKRNPREPGSPG